MASLVGALGKADVCLPARFRATVVESYERYWKNVVSPVLEVGDDCYRVKPTEQVRRGEVGVGVVSPISRMC